MGGEVGEMGADADHWPRAQAAAPSVSSPQRHVTSVLPFHKSNGHHGKQDCFVSRCHWLSL